MNPLVEAAVKKLNQGDVVGVPTETVYGLAAKINLPQAIDKIFSVKQRPFFDPLIVHVSSIEQARKLVVSWFPAAEILAKKFWPGPLTLVLPKNEQVSEKITSGLMTVGIRMPNHPLTLELIAATGPLAAPSANLFGKTSPTQAEHVRNSFSDQVFVIDGGESEVGIESTVILVEEKGFKILRPGAITKKQIIDELLRAGIFLEELKEINPQKSPGHMKHHYMPDKPLIIGSKNLLDQEVIQEYQKFETSLPSEVEGVKIIKPHIDQNTKVSRLILNEDPKVAARELYSQLRNVTQQPGEMIYFQMPTIFQDESWEAVRDRLLKAATLNIG